MPDEYAKVREEMLRKGVEIGGDDSVDHCFPEQGELFGQQPGRRKLLDRVSEIDAVSALSAESGCPSLPSNLSRWGLNRRSFHQRG